VTINSSCASALGAFHAAVRDCERDWAWRWPAESTCWAHRDSSLSSRSSTPCPTTATARYSAQAADRLGGGAAIFVLQRKSAHFATGDTSCRSSRQRHQPRRPQRRFDAAELPRPGHFVPPRHRRGGGPSRRVGNGRRHGTGTRLGTVPSCGRWADIRPTPTRGACALWDR